MVPDDTGSGFPVGTDIKIGNLDIRPFGIEEGASLGPPLGNTFGEDTGGLTVDELEFPMEHTVASKSEQVGVKVS